MWWEDKNTSWLCSPTLEICLGNIMISGAIRWKEHEPLVRVQFVVFEKFTSAYLHLVAGEIIFLHVNNLHDNASQKVKTDEILAARALFVICTHITTLHPVLYKKCTRFRPMRRA